MALRRTGFTPPSKEKIAEINQKKRDRIINSKDKKKPKATKSSYKDINAATEARKSKQKASEKGYKAPKWFMSIGYGAHGHSPATKRLWRVVTDTYREEEWKKYGPNCPICYTPLPDWRDGQMLHWLRYASCNSWLKWEHKNMLFGCAGCNKNDTAITQWKMGKVLKWRYGEDVLLWIEQENTRLHKLKIKIEVWHIVDYVARLRPDLVQEE